MKNMEWIRVSVLAKLSQLQEPFLPASCWLVHSITSAALRPSSQTAQSHSQFPSLPQLSNPGHHKIPWMKPPPLPSNHTGHSWLTSTLFLSPDPFGAWTFQPFLGAGQPLAHSPHCGGQSITDHALLPNHAVSHSILQESRTYCKG